MWANWLITAAINLQWSLRPKTLHTRSSAVRQHERPENDSFNVKFLIFSGISERTSSCRGQFFFARCSCVFDLIFFNILNIHGVHLHDCCTQTLHTLLQEEKLHIQRLPFDPNTFCDYRQPAAWHLPCGSSPAWTLAKIVSTSLSWPHTHTHIRKHTRKEWHLYHCDAIK